MIPEKMMELIVMSNINKSLNNNVAYSDWFKKTYNIDKFLKRYNELGEEFLRPYMKTFTSKED